MPPGIKPQARPFEEAARFFREKVNLPTEKYTDLMGGMHSRAFVIAGGMKSEFLSDMHGSILSALKEGRTIADFRKDFDGIVKKHGWSYKGNRGWRTATIFNTNIRTAHSAGRYAQMTSPAVLKARPYFKYIGGLSANPRPEHLEWNGTILPADDAWWASHFTPNGWGCKCQVTSLSRREMERDGLKVSKRPDNGTYEWTNPHTGEVTEVPVGIDPGWDYNPGHAAWGERTSKGLIDRASSGKWEDIDPWLPSAYKRPAKIALDAARASIGSKARSAEALRKSLSDAIGGDEAFFKSPFGETVCINQALVDHMLEKPGRIDGRQAYFPFIPELIEDPYEIWVNFARNMETGQVAVRERYIKAIKTKKGQALFLTADVENGMWTGLTFFQRDIKKINKLRRGRLIYGRK